MSETMIMGDTHASLRAHRLLCGVQYARAQHSRIMDADNGGERGRQLLARPERTEGRRK